MEQLTAYLYHNAAAFPAHVFVWVVFFLVTVSLSFEHEFSLFCLIENVSVSV